MPIHNTHQMEPGIEQEGRILEHCADCGLTDTSYNEKALTLPCDGPPPALQIHDDGEVISVQWSFPEGGAARSSFPQPLVTVDHALDGRPVGATFVGPRARELRAALKPKLSDEEIKELKGIVRGGVKWIDTYKGDAYLGTTGGRLASRLLSKAGIETKVDGRTGKVTFE